MNSRKGMFFLNVRKLSSQGCFRCHTCGAHSIQTLQTAHSFPAVHKLKFRVKIKSLGVTS